MMLQRRAFLAVTALVAVVIVAFLIDTTILQAYVDESGSTNSILQTAAIDRYDLRYGPQSWRPYATPIAIGLGDIPPEVGTSLS